MNDRAAESKACPGKRSTSYTIGGTSWRFAERAGLRCSNPSLFAWHSGHWAWPVDLPPQAHFRCSVAEDAGANEDIRFEAIVISVMEVACSRVTAATRS